MLGLVGVNVRAIEKEREREKIAKRRERERDVHLLLIYSTDGGVGYSTPFGNCINGYFEVVSSVLYVRVWTVVTLWSPKVNAVLPQTGTPNFTESPFLHRSLIDLLNN